MVNLNHWFWVFDLSLLKHSWQGVGTVQHG